MISKTLSVKQAAGFLNVQPKTVRAWIKLGRLPASRIGKQYFILEPEIERLIGAGATVTASSLDHMAADERRADLIECLGISVTPSTILAERQKRNAARRERIEGRS